jgi:transposase-like protein
MERKSSRAELERSRGVVRALHLGELEAAGREREVALAAADAALDRIARRLPDALEAGISLSEIARATGVSRPTLYELRGRYTDSQRDLRLALLQLLATRGPVEVSRLPEEVGRPDNEYREVLEALINSDLVEWDLDEEADPPQGVYVLTWKGHGLLEHWEFEDREGDAP